MSQITNQVKVEENSISGLYYRYGKSSDQNIAEFFEKVKLVRYENKGPGTIQGYYPLTDESMQKIMEKPRNLSPFFSKKDFPTKGTPMDALEEHMRFNVLVKSSSRFFLKPDIGELVDAVPDTKLFFTKARAIILHDGSHELLPDTNGEHFIMQASLLT